MPTISAGFDVEFDSYNEKRIDGFRVSDPTFDSVRMTATVDLIDVKQAWRLLSLTFALVAPVRLVGISVDVLDATAALGSEQLRDLRLGNAQVAARRRVREGVKHLLAAQPARFAVEVVGPDGHLELSHAYMEHPQMSPDLRSVFEAIGGAYAPAGARRPGRTTTTRNQRWWAEHARDCAAAVLQPTPIKHLSRLWHVSESYAREIRRECWTRGMLNEPTAGKFTAELQPKAKEILDGKH